LSAFSEYQRVEVLELFDQVLPDFSLQIIELFKAGKYVTLKRS